MFPHTTRNIIGSAAICGLLVIGYAAWWVVRWIASWF